MNVWATTALLITINCTAIQAQNARGDDSEGKYTRQLATLPCEVLTHENLSQVMSGSLGVPPNELGRPEVVALIRRARACDAEEPSTSSLTLERHARHFLMYTEKVDRERARRVIERRRQEVLARAQQEEDAERERREAVEAARAAARHAQDEHDKPVEAALAANLEKLRLLNAGFLDKPEQRRSAESLVNVIKDDLRRLPESKRIRYEAQLSVYSESKPLPTSRDQVEKELQIAKEKKQREENSTEEVAQQNSMDRNSAPRSSAPQRRDSEGVLLERSVPPPSRNVADDRQQEVLKKMPPNMAKAILALNPRKRQLLGTVVLLKWAEAYCTGYFVDQEAVERLRIAAQIDAQMVDIMVKLARNETMVDDQIIRQCGNLFNNFGPATAGLIELR